MSALSICKLAYEGKKEEFKSAVEFSPAVLTHKDEDERQALHWACSGGHLDLVQFILAQGVADVNAADDSGWTPLHIAVSVGHEGIVKELLDKQADVSRVNDTKQTPLHYAASKNRLQLAKILLDHGADAHARDGTGATALHRCAARGYTDMARLLLKSGAQANAQDNSRNTPLHLAVGEDHGELVLALIDEFRADWSLKNRDEATPLALASTQLLATLRPFLEKI